jgi:hypothetical protein
MPKERHTDKASGILHGALEKRALHYAGSISAAWLRSGKALRIAAAFATSLISLTYSR